MDDNRAWINKQMDEGREIRDLGIDVPGKGLGPEARSPWYAMERNEIWKRHYYGKRQYKKIPYRSTQTLSTRVRRAVSSIF